MTKPSTRPGGRSVRRLHPDDVHVLMDFAAWLRGRAEERKALTCKWWGCDQRGQFYDVNIHQGEGDESPECLTDFALCETHAAWISDLGHVLLDAIPHPSTPQPNREGGGE